MYRSTTDIGEDTQMSDYEIAVPSNGHYGDALYETSAFYQNIQSWFAGFSNFPKDQTPFFTRGGEHYHPEASNLFAYYYATGNSGSPSFRVVVPVF